MYITKSKLIGITSGTDPPPIALKVSLSLWVVSENKSSPKQKHKSVTVRQSFHADPAPPPFHPLIVVTNIPISPLPMTNV